MTGAAAVLAFGCDRGAADTPLPAVTRHVQQYGVESAINALPMIPGRHPFSRIELRQPDGEIIQVISAVPRRGGRRALR